MPFEWFLALRYMRDARGQTSLILAGVAVGVSVIVFLSALIGGLQASLIDKTLGSQAHVIVRNAREAPRPLVDSTPDTAVARTIEPAGQRLRSIDQWPSVLATLARSQPVGVPAAEVSSAMASASRSPTSPWERSNP